MPHPLARFGLKRNFRSESGNMWWHMLTPHTIENISACSCRVWICQKKHSYRKEKERIQLRYLGISVEPNHQFLFGRESTFGPREAQVQQSPFFNECPRVVVWFDDDDDDDEEEEEEDDDDEEEEEDDDDDHGGGGGEILGSHWTLIYSAKNSALFLHMNLHPSSIAYSHTQCMQTWTWSTSTYTRSETLPKKDANLFGNQLLYIKRTQACVPRALSIAALPTPWPMTSSSIKVGRSKFIVGLWQWLQNVHLELSCVSCTLRENCIYSPWKNPAFVCKNLKLAWRPNSALWALEDKLLFYLFFHSSP